MWTEFLFAWPDQLPAASRYDNCSAEAISIALRLQNVDQAEQALVAASALCRLPSVEVTSILRGLLALKRGDADVLAICVDHLSRSSQAYPEFFSYLQAQLALLQGDLNAILPFSDPSWSSSHHWQPMYALRLAVCIARTDLPQCHQLLANRPEVPIAEVVQQQAILYQREQKFDEALSLLADAVRRFSQLIDLQSQYVNCLLEARSQSLTLPSLRNALAAHGEHPALLGAVCAVKLLQRQPSFARRATLLQRLWPADAQRDAARLSNALVTYEQMGHSDWLVHLSPAVSKACEAHLPILENRCLQLASVQSPSVIEPIAAVMQAYADNPLPASRSLMPPRSLSAHRPCLRIGWVSADICHHPVARFILSFFESAGNLSSSGHQHILVNLCDHKAESYIERFQCCDGLQQLDATDRDPAAKLDAIRAAQLDVAIDLSGWTGGHFLRGFHARLAPLQVNYLGYFASTGLPSMDAWVGDRWLLPDPMCEWHSEVIHRLPRCFIAWQPSRQLDEASIAVAEAPTSPDIRFGCFNHNRKLSDQVLRLWGQLLGQIPGSTLVLKANASSDPYTQDLLVRRMRRAGLDPERVIWLPLAPTHSEHLRQYSQVDIALDSFPNGGCTTTCEALWMGVPVITLTGSHYVSRMSTAVLHGANLGHWCASTPQNYLQIAREQAEHLPDLRSSRENWRRQVIRTPLGDASDLMHHLQIAFSELYASKHCAQAS